MMLCYPNRIDEAALSGGAWSPAAPLAAAQDRVIAVRTRSVDTAVASVTIDIDLRRTRPIRAIAVIDHNLTVNARYRVTGAERADFSPPNISTGWLPLWGVIYPYGSVPWEDEHFWTGGAVTEDLAGYRLDLIHLLPTASLAQFWRIEIDDAANPDGYVEFGRLFIGDGWQPIYNMSYGNTVQYTPRTDVAEALSGTETFDVRPARRVQRCALDWLTPAEASGRAFELQRRVGIDGEVLFVHDPADPINRHRRCFLGRLRQLSAIEHPYFNVHRMPVEIQEIL